MGHWWKGIEVEGASAMTGRNFDRLPAPWRNMAIALIRKQNPLCSLSASQQNFSIRLVLAFHSFNAEARGMEALMEEFCVCPLAKWSHKCV